jgi:hypothetical protein
MRVRRILPLLASLAVLVACSGSTSTELFDPGPSSSTAPTDPTQGSPASSSSSSGGGSSSGASSSSSSSSSSGGFFDAGGGPDPAPCTPEAEPNDRMDQATRFDACLAGTISTRADVDYGKFVPPVNATRLSYSFSSKDGNVAVRVLLNGNVALGSPNGDLPIAPGATYLTEVKLAPGDTTARPAYELRVTYK